MADVYGGKIKYKQDLPPKGGYQQILWERTFPKTWATASKLFGLWGITVAFGMYQYYTRRKKILRMELEQFECKIAMEPFIIAERDRNYLRWCRFLRDEENEVMKDVPGWKTGTWYGEPTYFTLGDQWRDVGAYEFFAHSRMKNYNKVDHFRDYDWYAGPHWYDKYIPDILKEYIFH